MVAYLPHLNAALNCTATVLLIAGYVLIRRGRENAHKRSMISAFVASTAFLISYLVYHRLAGHRPLPSDVQGLVRKGYYLVLATHIILATLVPFLAILTIVLGLRDRRVAHRRLARWTLPIWLYVSITGVLIYLMLYWLYPLT